MKIGCLLQIKHDRELILADTKILKENYDVEIIVNYNDIQDYIKENDIIYIANINIPRVEFINFLQTIVTAKTNLFYKDFLISDTITRVDFITILNVISNIRINKSNRFGRNPLEENLINDILRLHKEEHRSLKYISDLVGVSRSTVYKYIQKNIKIDK